MKKTPTPTGVSTKESMRALVDALDPSILTPQVWVELVRQIDPSAMFILTYPVRHMDATLFYRSAIYSSAVVLAIASPDRQDSLIERFQLPACSNEPVPSRFFAHFASFLSTDGKVPRQACGSSFATIRNETEQSSNCVSILCGSMQGATGWKLR